MPGFKIKEQEGYDLSTAEIETIEAIAVLGDPGADRILFWDESANTWKFLTVGTGLDITDTTLTATGAYRIPIQCNDRYIKVSAKGTGTVTNSSMTIKASMGVN